MSLSINEAVEALKCSDPKEIFKSIFEYFYNISRTSEEEIIAYWNTVQFLQPVFPDNIDIIEIAIATRMLKLCQDSTPLTRKEKAKLFSGLIMSKYTTSRPADGLKKIIDNFEQ